MRSGCAGTREPARQSRKDARREKKDGGGITAARSLFAEFMHSTQREAAARKGLVDFLDAERQHGPVRSRTCRSLHHLAKLGQRYRNVQGSYWSNEGIPFKRSGEN